MESEPVRRRGGPPIFFFGLELLIPVVILGLIVLAVSQVAADRREPDLTGRRPYAIYLFVVTFVALFVALFSLVAVTSSVVRLALPESNFNNRSDTFPSEIEPPPGASAGAPIYEEFQPQSPNSEHISRAVGAGLFFVAALIVLAFHVRRIRELEASGALAEAPIRRGYQAYLYAVCFVSVLIVLVAGALAAFGIVRIGVPGTTGYGATSAERNEGIAQLVSAGMLAIAAYVVFMLHWRRASALRDSALQPKPPPAA